MVNGDVFYSTSNNLKTYTRHWPSCKGVATCISVLSCFLCEIYIHILREDPLFVVKRAVCVKIIKALITFL